MAERVPALNQEVPVDATAEQIAVDCIHRRLRVLLLATRRRGAIRQGVPRRSRSSLTIRITDHPVLGGRPWILLRHRRNGDRVSCVVPGQMLMRARMILAVVHLGLHLVLPISQRRKTNLTTMTRDNRGRITLYGRWTFITGFAVRHYPRAAPVS